MTTIIDFRDFVDLMPGPRAAVRGWLGPHVKTRSIELLDDTRRRARLRVLTLDAHGKPQVDPADRTRALEHEVIYEAPAPFPADVLALLPRRLPS